MSALRNCGFQSRAQCRPSPQLDSKSFDRGQCRWTDVMLHSFDVIMNDAVIQTE
jgi:hypothetical protein